MAFVFRGNIIFFKYFMFTKANGVQNSSVCEIVFYQMFIYEFQFKLPSFKRYATMEVICKTSTFKII